MNNAEKAVRELIRRGWHISAAESCTGGLLAAALVGVPDASRVLDVSFVTYANAAKIRYLGVREETIAAVGVVSEEVAARMAEGVRRESGAQVGLATSGIAGPTGGTAEKPVGTVCFGIALPDKTIAFTWHFGDIGRQAVRQAATEEALRTLCRALGLPEETG